MRRVARKPARWFNWLRPRRSSRVGKRLIIFSEPFVQRDVEEGVIGCCPPFTNRGQFSANVRLPSAHRADAHGPNAHRMPFPRSAAADAKEQSSSCNLLAADTLFSRALLTIWRLHQPSLQTETGTPAVPQIAPNARRMRQRPGNLNRLPDRTRLRIER